MTDRAELQLSPEFKLTTKGLEISGDPSYEQWEAVGETLKFLESSIQFALGDWLRYGERRWGEKYAQAAEETGYSEGTLRLYTHVANSVNPLVRTNNLTFTHHQLVAPLRLPDGAPDVEKQRYYLELAEKKELPVAKLREVIKQDKRAEKEATRPQPAPAIASPILLVGRAENLELGNDTVDLIITSPPVQLRQRPYAYGRKRANATR